MKGVRGLLPYILLAVLALLSACYGSEPELPTLDGPSPRKIPLDLEIPQLSPGLKVGKILYGTDSRFWLGSWDTDSSALLWEIPGQLLLRDPVLVPEGLVIMEAGGQVGLRQPQTGSLIWSVPVAGLEDLIPGFRRGQMSLTDFQGGYRVLDLKTGFIFLQREPLLGRPWRPFLSRQKESLQLPIKHQGTPVSAQVYPPVPLELVNWLSQKKVDPALVRFYPQGQGYAVIPQAALENFIVFTAWKPGVYTFSTPDLEHLPALISLKDFWGTEMDSTMGYGELLSSINWRMKKSEPVLLHVSLLNPDHAGQDLLLKVEVH